MSSDPIIICDISAYQYWRCPPVLLETEIPLEQACAPIPDGGAGMDPALFRLRANAREADRLIASRLLTDLKGLTTPVHVMVGAKQSRYGNPLVTVHRAWPDLDANDIVSLGGGLAVLTPEATLAHLARRLSHVDLLILAFECAGIHCVHRDTPLTRLLLDELISHGLLTKELQDARPDRIRAFLDANGNRAPMISRSGSPLPWELSFDRFGRPTDLWKRPPLIQVDRFKDYASSQAGRAGSKTLREVAFLTHGGSASPLETRGLLTLCLDGWKGGEGWEWPSINRRVDMDHEAQLVSKLSYCVCDALWADADNVLEFNGEAYHADRMGFKETSGRTAALEHLGYTVQEITYEQLADLEQYDIVIGTLAEKFGLSLQKRTGAFLKRREALHRQLFAPHTSLKRKTQ